MVSSYLKQTSCEKALGCWISRVPHAHAHMDSLPTSWSEGRHGIEQTSGEGQASPTRLAMPCNSGCLFGLWHSELGRANRMPRLHTTRVPPLAERPLAWFHVLVRCAHKSHQSILKHNRKSSGFAQDLGWIVIDLGSFFWSCLTPISQSLLIKQLGC